MEINALLMDEKDNVVTCVTEVAAGQDVVYRKGQEFCTVKAEENIPYCHKVALVDLKKRRRGHQVRREPWCDDRGRCKGPLGLPQQSGQRAA